MNAFKPEIQGEQFVKTEFAKRLLKRPKEAFKIACELTGNNPVVSSWIANNWVNDPGVLAIQSALVHEHGKEHFLPDEYDVSQEIWDTAKNCYDDDTKLKGLKLYAEVNGMIKKGPVVDNSMTIIAPKVMAIPAPSSDKDWQQKAIEQQQGLIVDSTAEQVN